MLVTACLVIIGDEILSGRTQDMNLQILARRLGERGVQLVHVRVLSDDEAVIISNLREVRVSYDYIFTTGGIGPTHDDITSETVAKALGLSWEINVEAFSLLESYYLEAGVPFNESRQKMAMMPAGSGLLYNPISVAPGFHIENFFILAGVPSIMDRMLDTALPLLKGGTVLHSQALSCTLGEGVIASMLSNFQDRYPSVTIGSYPIFQFNNLSLQLVLRSGDRDILQQLYDELFSRLVEMDGSPEAVVV